MVPGPAAEQHDESSTGGDIVGGAAAEAAAPAESPGRDLTTLPGIRDLEMMRDAGAALGIESPYFRAHDGVAGGRSSIGGRSYINFASYNYIGLNGDARVAAAAKAAIDRHGVSASASRLASGERPVHAALEAALAAHYGTEACITLVSGHATNVTVIGQILGPRDLILHDRLIHNSVAEGARLSGARRIAFDHNDWAAAERELAAQRRRHGRALLVIEGHYSMDGDLPDLPRFAAIARRHDALLMVDEAHSLGVLGATGRGIAEQCGADPGLVDIWMGTLSKTLSACGGYIAGKRRLVDLLRHTAPGFVYSVGLAPPLAASALESLASCRPSRGGWRSCRPMPGCSCGWHGRPASIPATRPGSASCRSSSAVRSGRRGWRRRPSRPG